MKLVVQDWIGYSERSCTFAAAIGNKFRVRVLFSKNSFSKHWFGVVGAQPQQTMALLTDLAHHTGELIG